MKKGLRRILLVVLSCIVGLIVVAVLAVTFALRGSLPTLDGEKSLPGLIAQVEITRDELGVPHISADNRLDAAMALGYLHAQDRFFQMDLQRRSAAGELAGLMGPAAVGMDRNVRIHRFRQKAQLEIEETGEELRAILDAYTDGVNAGLDGLSVRPFEYLVLRKRPEPWLAEDTFLTVYAMFLDLALSTASTEKMNSYVSDILPAGLADYLLTPAARWDAPLQEGGPFPATVPDSSEVDLRKWITKSRGEEGYGVLPGREEFARLITYRDRPGYETPERELPGSNNWAVAGSLTSHGGALLANDMHLSHGIPNIWYRARMTWKSCGEERSVVGATLPGTGALIVGSNGDVAWGFTNSYIDCADLVRLEIDPEDSTQYLTTEGREAFGMIPEIIEVAGAAPDTLWVRQTRWGPVWGSDSKGAPLALRWTAHDTEAVDIALMDLEKAEDVDQAVLAAARSGIPPLNFVCADASGDIAWTIAGRVPRRVGWDGKLPVSWADGSCRWDGYVAPEDQPKIVRPEEGRLWTANNRVVGGHYFSVLGDGGYALGARARQIRDGLREMDSPDEDDMLALQLDDRALYLDEWRKLALDAVEGDTTASRVEFARILREDWSGHASPESAGYSLAYEFTSRLINILYQSLTGPLWTNHDDFKSYWLSYRQSITWQLVHERPPHMLLPVFHESWDDLLLHAVDETMERATAGGREASEWDWGGLNMVDISHPFVRFAPQLRRFLAAPLQAIPGGSHMPRVQHRRFGASERLVVSPGREEDGIFEMPGGQSGHPMSKYFLAGHEDWVHGRRSPLLPGEPGHRLVLRPEQVRARDTQ